MRNLGLMFMVFGLLVACAHHRDVRPGDQGIHKVIVKSEETEQGAREAIKQANHYCEQSKQSAVFVDEDQKYTGDLDEETYKTAKRASTIAKTVGGGVWVFGGKKASDVGGIVGLGGAATDAALGEGYTVEMRFKCK